MHYPHNPLQPGPMYFKTARKCAVFGICCEGIPRQVIDEASDVGKGANSVISFLHHFFQHHGLGEVDVGLHADNCVGQNKQFYELHVHLRVRNTTHCVVRLVLECTISECLAWRVLTGLHRTVRMSFMLVGHTKFAPDWCFGLFKQRYRRTFVSSLDDVVDVVNTSADVNVAQLVEWGACGACVQLGQLPWCKL